MIPAGFRGIDDWFSPVNKGTSVAVGDVTGNGTPDLVVLAVDGGPQPNRGAYRIGRDLGVGGDVSAGWTPWIQVPDWFSRDTQGAGITVADLNGNGKLDLVVLMVDNAAQLNRGVYRVGRDLDGDGNAAGGWSDWIDMPGWFSWDNQGGGVAVADTTGNGHPDIVVFGIDNPPQQNQAFYRIAFDVNGDGVPAGAQPADPQAGWSSLLGVNNWFSWENQGSGIAVVPLGGEPTLLVLASDHPQAGSVGFYTTVRLTESPHIHGQWEVLPFNSEVLAIHAAMLRTGRVLFFSGSGNNTVRVADPAFGQVAAGMYTSVVWDPQAPDGQNFAHPPTIFRQDGRPFDFFCGGDTFLADGRVLSAGGTQDYNAGNDLGQREATIFDPVTGQWAAAPPMAHGRWYPQLLLFPDGHVLAVSRKPR
jgi:hypothetical protein